MATTSKGIYYPNDGTKKAGVMADMQRMAESIDDALTENEFDPTEINQNISNLQVSQKAQDLAIENLQEAFLNGTVDESQSLEVDDAKGIGKLEVLGNYVQDEEPSELSPVEIKCVGSNKKNLFSLDNKIENAYIDHFDGILVNDPEYDTFFIEMKEGEDYVLSFKIQNEAMLGALITWGEVDEFPKIGMNLDFGYYYRDELKDMVNMVFDSNKKYLLISLYKPTLDSMYDIQFEEGIIATPYVPYGRGSTEIKIENKDRTQTKVYTLPIQKEMLTGDYFTKETDGWKEIHVWEKIDSYNGETITTDYISTTGTLTTGATVYYKLQTAVKLNCTEEQIEVLEQLNNLELFEGINYISTTENIALLKLKYATNKDELAEVKQDISDLQESQTEQDKQLQILTNALPSETQEGESINIKGTIPVKFKEFVVKGNSKQETRSGKNIVNINSTDIVNINTTIEVENNTLTVTGSSTTNFYSAIPINLKPNTDYSISTLATVVEQNGLSQSAYIRVRSDLAGSWIGNSILINKDSTTQQILKGTFNSGDNENAYLILYLSPLNDGTQRSAKIEFENLQIEEGSTATDYEPYGAMPSPEFRSEIHNVEGDVNVTIANSDKTEQQVVTFPLSEGQKLYKGDYLADDGIHHVRKQIELDGTDFSLYSNQVAGRTIYMISAFSNNNNFKTYDSSILCNILKQGTSSNGNNYLNNNGSSGSLYVSIENSILGITDESTNEEKLQTFQNLIAETGFFYEGELAEEEIEPYTEEQQEAYNQISNLKAYEEETNVYSTNSTSPIFKVTAVQSTNAMLTQMKQLILEGGN